MCPTKFLWFFTTDQTTISFYPERISKRIQWSIWMSWGKYRKVQNFFSFDINSFYCFFSVFISLIFSVFIATFSQKVNFIDSARLMASSLSNLVDNLAEEIHKTKCKDCDCFLEYGSVSDNLIKEVFIL